MAHGRTCEALRKGGYQKEAGSLLSVCDTGKRKAWEQYARDTFLAQTRHIPSEKLRFLQYVKPNTVGWWNQYRAQGAVLLGAAAGEYPQGLPPGGPSLARPVWHPSNPIWHLKIQYFAPTHQRQSPGARDLYSVFQPE